MLDAPVLTSDIASEAIAGLAPTRKTLPPKLFYDAAGVRLFEQITMLPEYYLTRAETALLRRIAPELAALARRGSALVEYGASDEAKASLLLRARGGNFSAYVPVDVAESALADIEARLRRAMPRLAVHPLCADFTRAPKLPAAIRTLPKLGFFPGSTIGNLDPAEARAFLRHAREALGQGAWLIVGADPCQDSEKLVAAYDDAAGVTAAFNLNVLHRLNREADADFDADKFEHVAIWNAPESRMEMHLRSTVNQRVRIAGMEFRFAAGETIHTENSYKHTVAAFRALATSAGWQPRHVWTDPDNLFSVHALVA